MAKFKNVQPVEVVETESLEQVQKVFVPSETVQEAVEEVSSPEVQMEPAKPSSGLLARLENLEEGFKEMRAARDEAVSASAALKIRFDEVMASIAGAAQPPYDDAFVLSEIKLLDEKLTAKADSSALDALSDEFKEVRQNTITKAEQVMTKFETLQDKVADQIATGLAENRAEIKAINDKPTESVPAAIAQKLDTLERAIDGKADAEHLQNLSRELTPRLDALEKTVGGD